MNQTTRLLKKEKKEREVDEQLQKKRKEIEEKGAIIEEQHRQFKERQTEIKTKIDKKEPQILMYDRKIKQETDKIKKEDDLIKIKEEEIKRKEEQLGKAEAQLQEIERKIEQYSIYKSFLEEVVRVSEEYEDIPQLMKRYITLKTSKQDQDLNGARVEEATSAEKESYSKIINKMKDDIAEETGKMTLLGNEIDDLNTQITALESKQEDIRKERILRKGITGKIVLAIKNLHSKALKSKQTFAGRKDETEEKPDKLIMMLQNIRERFIDLKKITLDVQEYEVSKKVVGSESPYEQEEPSV
eukprot:CAMPEP_0202950824 /NCGR_PEP_ID=MMETSP1395-20130829/25902_1 /ASSEMBLY_ACC=CAM_ASM_000871 /TAXON_ID=5961 /ORGANISM="Blepharisma japonicum, Strain Stock R1072" /LENGTH=299 /DNA_ID=CAMNT_0049656255 /DNA_START=60 /DNA_END=955 /DNA_ORIENTATION=+